MDRFVIKGGNRLEGSVSVSGAKNSALKLMAAAILGDNKSILQGVPKIRDVFTMIEVLNRLGIKAEFKKEDQLVIDPSGNISCEASYDLISQMRASIVVLGPLLAKLGEARVAMPGGCNIGSRKIDLHLRGFELLGAQIDMGQGYIQAKADILVGATVTLAFPSVGATENLMMAAVKAKGITVIENAAREPEIIDLANFLNSMGADIEGAGTSSIKVQGVAALKGIKYQVIPDRIEAGTFLIAGAISRGDIIVKNACPEHLEMVLGKLRDSGFDIKEQDTGVRIIADKRAKAVDIATLPYPGFPTDLQAQMMALLSLADGTSVITENIFENRFVFVSEINKMGSNIRTQGQHAVIEGAERIKGACVRCPDLRAGAGLILAGLAAKGTTEVEEIGHVERGYENFEQKLSRLGADIQRVPEEMTEVAQSASECVGRSEKKG